MFVFANGPPGARPQPFDPRLVSAFQTSSIQHAHQPSSETPLYRIVQSLPTASMDTSSDEEAAVPVVAVKTGKKRKKKGKGSVGRRYKGKGHPHGKKEANVADAASTIVSPPVCNTRSRVGTAHGSTIRHLDLSIECGNNVDDSDEAGSGDDSASRGRDDSDSDSVASSDTADETDVVPNPDAILDFQEIDVQWSKDVLPANSRNIAIAYLYVEEHNAAEPDSWGGKDGVMKQIKGALKIKPNTSIRNVLLHVWACHKKGIVYNGRTSFEPKKRGPKPLMDLKSPKAALIVEALEKGYSRRQTLQFINHWLKKEGQDLITLHQIGSLVSQLNPSVTIIEARKQGSADVNSRWSRARKNWVTQLLIRQGHNADDLGVKRNDDGTLPACYDIEKLTPLNANRIAWFDETHRKCKIGGQAGSSKNTQVTFPRNGQGQLDPAGTIETKKVCFLHHKFENEVRLLLGCAMPKNDNGDVAGVMLPSLSYSGKKVLTNRQFQTQIQLEIARVKTFSDGGTFWNTSNRKHKLYRDDPITKIKGIKDKTAAKKLTPNNILTVGNLLDYKDNRPALVAFTKICAKCIDKYMKQAIEDCPSSDPLPATERTDHHKAANPYESKYGPNWMTEIKGAELVRNFANIQDLVEHMYITSKQLFNPTDDPLKDDWFFYHDALSLMTAADTVSWMKSKGYYKHWVLPECGLSEDDRTLKEFWGRPLGNSPEMMPLDCNLNKDVHDVVQAHCAATAHIADNGKDPRKFSLSTPQRGDSAYLRVLEGAPDSTRIIQDCSRWESNILEVWKAQGAIVVGLGDRQGRRRDQAPAKRGGKRVRKSDDEFVVRWMHPDAISARDEFAAMTLEQYALRIEEVIDVENQAMENAGGSIRRFVSNVCTVNHGNVARMARWRGL
jgi:hypothetical protein